MNRQDAGPQSGVAGAALLAKFFRLLAIVDAMPSRITVNDIVARTGWSRQTAYRILNSAIAEGFIRYDAQMRGFSLGFRVVELAQNAVHAGDLVALAAPELRRLRDLTGETVYLASYTGKLMAGRARFESFHADRSSSRSDVEKPLHATSLGKACLAFADEWQSRARLKRLDLRRYTPRTIGDPAALAEELDRIRLRGFAIDDEEILTGMRCIGAPILDGDRRPIAAVSLAGPVYRLQPDRIDQLGEEVRQTASDIGRRLIESTRPTGLQGLPEAHPGLSEPAFHGANPQWCAEEDVLHWCDSLAPKVHRTHRETRSASPEPKQPIRAMMLGQGRRVIAVTADRLIVFEDGAHVQVLPARAMAGLSGLSVRRDGVPYAAVFDGAKTLVGPVTPEGSLNAVWSVGAAIRSLKWHPSGETLFAAAPENGVIYALDHKAGTSRVFSRLSKAAGRPSGMAVDTQGGLWVAMYDGWSIARLDSFGEIERTISLPVSRPTGLAFGGATASRLFITTARIGLPRHLLERAPLSGWLLHVETGFRGGIQGVASFIPGQVCVDGDVPMSVKP